MNNKGLSLVELLAVIAIIAFVGGIGVVAYNLVIRQSEVKVYEAYETTMHSETLLLLQKHVELLPRANKTAKFWLNIGTNKGNCYDPDKPEETAGKKKCIDIDEIKNPRNKADICQNSYIEVTRDTSASTISTMDSFNYHVCLICNDYNSDGTDCEDFLN